MSYIKKFMVTAFIFFSIDLLWLGSIGKQLYARHLGHLMADQIFVSAAVIFYVLFITGLIYFVIQPALAKGHLKYALLRGMFFGLITYATYDLTNLATLQDWPIMITVIDLIWGTFLCGFTSALSYLILKRNP
ncbi:DUF2177 family protein [Fusibacter ferrireducens]|uniref:DUF2177 family protein n=1 Tax=Fusibacter ferrireducens TaxID=2785058 RepID=A0ABR9ZWK3_9FIRM|nr:DUF2177 family protein [Fusibacter ferrireducens]MBF4694839.1 DUF2177 family protein [Fusibacter ferrireducens]